MASSLADKHDIAVETPVVASDVAMPCRDYNVIELQQLAKAALLDSEEKAKTPSWNAGRPPSVDSLQIDEPSLDSTVALKH